MGTTMAAYRLGGWQERPALVEVPVPEPGPGQVLVRVAACGLCHSDLTMMAMPAAVGPSLGWEVPFTLGHESAGWVERVGPEVRSVREGDSVAVASPTSCGRCRACVAGRENACAQGQVGRGYGRDGGLAEFVLVDDERALVPLGELDPVLAAPLTDAGATSHHAVARVLPRVAADGTVAVIGVGGLGAFVVQILRASTSARVVAVDPDPVRRDLAARFGADAVLDGVGERGVDLRSIVGPAGADAVVDLVGTDDTIAAGLGSLGPGGAFALVGAAGGTLRRPWYSTLPRDGEVFTFQGSDLADLRGVVALAASGAVTVPVVPFALAEVVDAYGALEAGGLSGRVVVRP